jgi:hypothetical protein
MRFYASVFQDSPAADIVRYGKGEEPGVEGTVKHARFQLQGQQFAAMDGAGPHAFTFNEAISLMVYCDTQQEIDRYWERLSAVPAAEQCGWLKDQSLLADRPDGHGADDGQRRQGEAGTRDGGVSQDEEVRYRDTSGGV